LLRLFLLLSCFKDFLFFKNFYMKISACFLQVKIPPKTL
jgi:hypothetical protein